MPDATLLFAIDNTQDYQIVVQNDYCQRVTVQENYNSSTAPTADLLMKIPASAKNAISIPKGTAAVYTPLGPGALFFQAGQVVGTIRTVSGSITVQQVESARI